jgi:hypothetical protein
MTIGRAIRRVMPGRRAITNLHGEKKWTGGVEANFTLICSNAKKFWRRKIFQVVPSFFGFAV